MSALRLEGLRFLHDGPVDLTVGAGECVALSGPSGAGKTLLLRAIADLDRSGGRVFLADIERNSISAPKWRRRVGLLFSESAWWAERVGQHFSAPDGDTLARLGFPPDVVDWPVTRLSSGERQRLALARLLDIRPEALLLDEPTANLDSDNAARVEAVIEDYRREHAAPVLWVTHDPLQAARIAGRHLYLYSGGLHSTPPPVAR